MSDLDLIGFLSFMVCLPPASSAASVTDTAAPAASAAAGSSHALGTSVVTGHRRTSIHPATSAAKGTALAGTAAPRNIVATDAFPAAAATRAIGSASGTVGLTTSTTTGAIACSSSTATRTIASSGTALPPGGKLTLDLARRGPVIRGASAML